MTRRMSMQGKLVGALATMSAIALLAIGWFAARAVIDGRAESTQADHAAAVVELSVVVGDLVHQLQIERGLTVGFVASGGENFGPEIGSHRPVTDEAHAELGAFVDQEGDDLPTEVMAPVRQGLDALARLEQRRGGADALDLEGADVAAYFTDTIDDLLTGLELGFASVEEAELLRDGSAYLALLNGKEAAGLTRAQLNGVFTADAFSPAELESVGGLIGEQEAMFEEFLAYADDDVAQLYRDRAGSAAFARVEEFEGTAFDRALEGGFGIAPGDWFDASTQRIDLLREVETAHAEHLLERAEAIGSGANRAMMIDTVLSVLGLGLMLGLAIALTLWVRRRVVGPLTESARSLAGASEDMSAVSSQVGSNAEETAAQAGVVATAGEQVSQNVQSVATSVDELTSSINEIAQNASEATDVANEAVTAARGTNETVSRLGESSTEIGKVIELITSIAEQTNLLALNATIEAARAGEAGKGFAVVAGEVKQLAQETANATEEVGKRITAIQEDTGKAAEAINEVSGVIERIADMQTTIASAVEEQGSATNEIARSVNEAAEGAGQIAENISSVAEAAEDTTRGASRTQEVAGALAETARRLDALVLGEAAQRSDAARASGHPVAVEGAPPHSGQASGGSAAAAAPESGSDAASSPVATG